MKGVFVVSTLMLVDQSYLVSEQLFFLLLAYNLSRFGLSFYLLSG